jgi:hypothetical protein
MQVPRNPVNEVEVAEPVIPGADHQRAPLTHGRVLPQAGIPWSGFPATRQARWRAQWLRWC